MTSGDFRRVAASVSFPALEEEVLALWDRVDAFAMSVEMRPPDSEYTFYDGPPFASGSPHYGHILAGVIKDIVPRYWTMRGHRIERRFGWDTHGLPVEMEVEKELGVSGPKAIEAYGVARFNEACRAKVERTTEDWERIMRRLGRWVDFENDYKTMDPDFMESEWWVFSQLWDKGLIYRDFKVVPYSWGAATPLSNFEANMDYRDVDDPAITVRLRALEGHGPVREGDYFLIWTTTPWTLPGNLAIAVGEEIEYVAAKVDDHRYWIAEALVGGFWTDHGFVPGPGVHVGCAISLRDGGLVAPALHDVNTKAVDVVGRELLDLVKRARAGTLRSSEMSDATITVTNLGELGVESAFAIIYPPQVAIVAFGRVVERPWVVDGRVEPRPVITVSVSVDHRAIDGRLAGSLLAAIERALQAPEAL